MTAPNGAPAPLAPPLPPFCFLTSLLPPRSLLEAREPGVGAGGGGRDGLAGPAAAPEKDGAVGEAGVESEGGERGDEGQVAGMRSEHLMWQEKL